MDKRHELVAIANVDGTISLAIGPGIVNGLTTEEAIKWALVILQSAQNASYQKGFKPSDAKADSEEKFVRFRPDAIGSLGPDGSGLASLVVCVGTGKFALLLEKQQLETLSRILQTATAPTRGGAN